MADQREPTISRPVARVHPEPPPDLGKLIQEREIPSDVALVTPLIIRITQFLEEGHFLSQDFRNKFQLCLDEALRNAVIHGNRRDFSRKVRIKAFVGDSKWSVLIEDEGRGFVLEKVPDPLTDTSLWGESGRGIRLMELYMDGVDYYCGGRILVLSKFL